MRFIILVIVLYCASCKTSSSVINKALKKSSFYQISENVRISKYEVSNKEYRLFLNSIEKENLELYNKCKVDSAKWNRINLSDRKFNEPELSPHARNYFRFYEDFPVCNISIEGAKEYCIWLTNQKNQFSRSSYLIRLPTMEEFMETSKIVGQKILSDNISDYGFAPPQMTGPSMNLKYKNGDFIDYTFDSGITPTLVKPGVFNYIKYDLRNYINETGIFHLYGNVSEFVEEGFAIGGNFENFPSEVLNQIKSELAPDPTIGFRIVMEKKTSED